MSREWLLKGVSEEELKPTPKAEPPQTPRGKWENFWYHYKWWVIGISATVVCFAILMVQTLTRNPMDYEVVYVSQKPATSAQLELLQKELLKAAQDVDGDGNVELTVQNLYLTNGGDITLTDMAHSNTQKLTVYMASGDRLFFIFEEDVYKERMERLLAAGSEFYAPIEAECSDVSDGDLYWDWADSALQMHKTMKGMPKHLYFGVRAASGTAQKKTEEFAVCHALLTEFICQQTTQK